jgi:hypothetical protein
LTAALEVVSYTMKIKNLFSKSDVGASVVFEGYSGGSYSAKIIAADSKGVTIYYYPTCGQAHETWIPRADFSRLTRFPAGCSFLAITSEATFSK